MAGPPFENATPGRNFLSKKYFGDSVSQEDLNKQTESSAEISSTEKVGSSVNKELYRTEEKL